MTKKERVLAVLTGKKPDCVPAGFWYHFPGTLTPKEMAQAHIDFYRKSDNDIIKIMQDYMYPIEGEVKKPSDWKHVRMPKRDSPVYHKLEDVIKIIRDTIGDEALIFQTMFGPFKAASIHYGDALLMEHAKTDPAAVTEGIKIISHTLAEWADGYLDSGADGIYYSAQFSEVGRFTEPEWARLVKPFDLEVLAEAQKRPNKYNIVHLCGEPEYQFKIYADRYRDYPADLINWSVKDTGVTLRQGREIFKKPILGGVNNRGNILTGTPDQIREEIRTVITQFGSEGLMIGADCTIGNGQNYIDRIHTAIEETHRHKIV